MNSLVRSALMDLAGQRQRPDDPREAVFPRSYTQPDKFFPQAVDVARKTPAGHRFRCFPLGWVHVAL